MSHRWNCPSPWEAREEGRRAFEDERYIYSNPYYDHRRCHEAERSWDEGYRAAQYEAEQEAAASHRREQRLQEEEYLAEAERQWYERQEYDQERERQDEAEYYEQMQHAERLNVWNILP